MDPLLRAKLESGRVVAARDYPDQARRLAYRASLGELVRLLPGVFAVPQLARDVPARAAAAAAYRPGSVVVGDAAAALTYWPGLEVPIIEVASCRSGARFPGFLFTRRAIPSELIQEQRPVRMSAPALTALDQVAAHGGDGIDRALRTRLATLNGMQEALRLTPKRVGNRDRRAMLLDSRDEPWSALERRTHRLLRGSGITGWRTNVAVTAEGATYFVDVLFDDVPLVLELDGREFHGPDRFDLDRERDNRLVGMGFHVLHFTWTMVTERPEWVIATIRTALRRLGAAAA